MLAKCFFGQEHIVASMAKQLAVKAAVVHPSGAAAHRVTSGPISRGSIESEDGVRWRLEAPLDKLWCLMEPPPGHDRHLVTFTQGPELRARPDRHLAVVESPHGLLELLPG